MISQFFVLSPRGDPIVSRDFRGDGIRGLPEIFFKRVRRRGDQLDEDNGPSSSSCRRRRIGSGLAGSGSGSVGSISSPVMVCENREVCFVYVKRNGLNFVIVLGRVEAPLSYWIELLESLISLIKDFCGVLNEDTLRHNFALVYELADEVFDFGYLQSVKTGDLTNVIRNEAASSSSSSNSHTTGNKLTAAATSFALSNALTHLGAAGLAQLSSLANNTIGSGKLDLMMAGVAGMGAHATSNIITKPTSAMPKTVPSNASQMPINAGMMIQSTDSSSSTMTSMLSSNGAGLTSDGLADIFIDILDRTSVEMTSDGSVLRMSVDGIIVLKSYLDERLPLRMGLNEDLIIRDRNGTLTYLEDDADRNNAERNGYHNGYGDRRSAGGQAPPVIDDCLFHQCVSLKEFTSSRCLIFSPPQGEFNLMRYRLNSANQKSTTSPLRPPFICLARTTVLAKDRIQITVLLQPEPSHKPVAGVAAIQLDLPHWISAASTKPIGPNNSIHGQHCDAAINEHKIYWTHRRFNLALGEVGFEVRLTVDLDEAPDVVVDNLALAAVAVNGWRESSKADEDELVGRSEFVNYENRAFSSLTAEKNISRYFGPISISFELPMHTCTRLQIRYLKSALPTNGPNARPVPRRWVRYVTQSAAFTVRFTS